MTDQSAARIKTVAHLVPCFDFGGLEQVIVNLINNSTSYAVQHVIISLTDQTKLYPQVKPPTPLYTLNKKPGKDLGCHWKLFKLLKKIKPDTLHTYNFGTVEYHPIAALAGVKNRIHCEHGRGGDDPDGKDILHNLVRKISATLMRKFLVVSPDLLAWGKEVLNLSDDKIQLIYNGVNVDEYRPTTDKYPEFTVCTVGRADPVKNQVLLIDAFKQARRQSAALANAKLKIVGDGPVFENLKKHVNDKGLHDCVELLGFRTDVSSILPKAHLFVLSSIYEAMPMTILEAMSSGLPVIATDVGGVRHLMTENEGWLVPSKNVDAMAACIIEIASNPEQAQVRADRGRAMVLDKYSIQAMVANYMALYDVSPKSTTV